MIDNTPSSQAEAEQIEREAAIALLQEWIDSTDWDDAGPEEGQRANAVHVLLATARAGLGGPSQSELDAWRKRAIEAETEAAEYQRILREAHEAALKSPAVNSADSDDPRLNELRALAVRFATVRESVWMSVTGTARSGRRDTSESETKNG